MSRALIQSVNIALTIFAGPGQQSDVAEPLQPVESIASKAAIDRSEKLPNRNHRREAVARLRCGRSALEHPRISSERRGWIDSGLRCELRSNFEQRVLDGDRADIALGVLRHASIVSRMSAIKARSLAGTCLRPE